MDTNEDSRQSRNPYFVMLCWIIFLIFLFEGGTGMRKEDGENKCKSENA